MIIILLWSSSQIIIVIHPQFTMFFLDLTSSSLKWPGPLYHCHDYQHHCHGRFWDTEVLTDCWDFSQCGCSSWVDPERWDPISRGHSMINESPLFMHDQWSLTQPWHDQRSNYEKLAGLVVRLSNVYCPCCWENLISHILVLYFVLFSPIWFLSDPGVPGVRSMGLGLCPSVQDYVET